MINRIKKKNILLMCPSFFGYNVAIKNELEENGAFVTLFDERPKNDFFTKVLIRLNIKKIIKRRINKHFNTIISHFEKRRFD